MIGYGIRELARDHWCPLAPFDAHGPVVSLQHLDQRVYLFLSGAPAKGPGIPAVDSITTAPLPGGAADFRTGWKYSTVTGELKPSSG